MKRIAVIGLGKLGISMAAVYASKGFEVLGIDISKEAVQAANTGVLLTPEPRVPELLNANKSRLKFSTLFDDIENTEMSFIIVPTPTKKGERGFANDYVVAAIRAMGPALKRRKDYHVVVITSTVMPNAMNNVIRSALEVATGKKVGRDIGLCYNPEFVALGTVVKDMLHADIQLIGESDKRAGKALTGFHRSILPDVPIHRMTFKEAELTKLLLNVALSSRITYANLVGRIADSLGCDAHKILDAITDDIRIGKRYMRPGSPVEGPCLVRDVKALTEVLDICKIPSDLPQAMTNENAYLIRHVRNLLLAEGPCRVAILGWSYKPGTPLTDESAAFPIAEMLLNAGCNVNGYDPEAPIKTEGVDVYDNAIDCIKFADKIYVHTPWPEFAKIPKEKLRGKIIVDYWACLQK